MDQNQNTISPHLIVGLGNPGRHYQANRHNIGFMLVDHLARRLDLSFSRLEHKALITKTDYEGRSLIITKPQTYMNLSGQSVSTLTKYYKVSLENLMVAYDDVDLPFGTIRIRPSGGSAGQKGVASIIERLGTQEFPRLRLGIDRPPGRMTAESYVLRNFNNEQAELLPEFLERGVDAVLTFVIEGLVAAMNRFNSSGGGIYDR